MKLSIVIRCRNEAQGLRTVCSALKAQLCDVPWELVVVDNESTDETKSVCEQFGGRVVSIGAREFTYGRALNLGIREARGELVLLLSAHSIPIGTHFLESALAPFSDPEVAAARCLMIGNPSQIAKWFEFRNIHYNSAEEQRAAESGTEWLGDYPTAGCCVLRRSVWEQIPFNEQLESNEDKLWASQVLSRGHSIRCCADAVWLYGRKRSLTAEWNRRLREHVSLYRITGRKPLSWPAFLGLILLAFAVAPWVALQHIFHQIGWNYYLVSVPWRAKNATPVGAFREFDQHR